MALIEVRKVTKEFAIPSVRRDTVREHVLGLLRPRRFERLTVLDGVTFDVLEGSTVGIMGRNGSGKSTLLKILSGIYQPDAGTVTVGAAVTPILELGVGWNPELDAIDNILLVGTVMGVSLAAMRAATSRILEFAELTRFARLELKHYSSGMAARLAYAVAFEAVRPILILDEIFAVGDASFQARCEERYRALRDAGHTMLLVSHDPSTVAEFCDRGLLLEGGQVVVDDTAERVAEAYKRLLVGTPLHDSTATAARVVVTGDEPTPRVSVLVPCYDLGAYLDQAVVSVLAQTRQDVEVIVVDDGSTDPETVALLADYERPRTRVVRAAHRGLASARNAALAAARGEYVSFLDADDKLEPTFLEKAVAQLDLDESLSFVSCWVRFFGDEDWTWRQDSCDLPTLLAECTVATSALVRRKDALAVGGFDGSMLQGFEDWDLWISLLEHGCRGVILPEVLLLYRRRPGSMSSGFRRPEVHRELFRYLITKHRGSYAAHAFAVFAHREAEQARLAAEIHSLEVDLETRLRPEIARRRQELDLRLGRAGSARER